ncbi:LysE family translocator [Blastochloris viridis]|uniref:Homoserine/homoserine lactone efflux protein n=1 Tax=Blastochloris viridis TaxID=1079 RepID=A0A0H5BCJ7_BLAVI|nr:LysE family translocator [Blastochloris viridis]ALK08690.1 Homoserine/homoserine lactone efflux protein [Blastochloris viridis]BAR98016.1 RhtB family transporter [Blastochloris viridis]CUU41353.1 Homoserine/homoserine lactone efflux protein [Blastochloris viridis]
MSAEFLLTALIIVASPGTGVLYTLAYGLSCGRRAAVIAALAGTLGIVPHIAAAIAGLAALLHTSALAFETVKYAGVAYLLWMAWQTLKESGALAVGGADDLPAGRIIARGVTINLLNPKLSIFFLAFLPQFVEAGEAHPVARMLELSGVFMAMTFVVFAIYGVAAAAARTYVVGRPTVMSWLRRSFAAAFVALGARLALAER